MRKIASVLLSIFIISSCDQRSDNVVPDEISYSGRDIFTGLFFAQGPVASLIPEIGNSFNVDNLNLQPYQLIEMQTVQNELLNFIDSENPGFFDSFKSDMTSGDHLIIQDALANAARISMQAAQEYFNIRFSDELRNLDPRSKDEFLKNESVQELLAKGNDLTLDDMEVLLTKAGTSDMFLKSDYGVNGRGTCAIAWLGAFAMVAIVGGVETILFVHAVVAVYEWVCAEPLEQLSRTTGSDQIMTEMLISV